MTKVAVLDDWQGVAKTSADWSRLQARAEVVFFAKAFDNEDDAARQLADFDIVLSMRERTPLPASLINRLPKLRMLGMTGARNASLDTAACTARGVVVCNTTGGGNNEAATAELALGLLICAARADPGWRCQYPSGKISGRRAGRTCARRQDHGDHRTWATGLAHGALLQGAEHEPARLESEPDAGARAGGWCGHGFKGQELLSRSDAVSVHLVLSDRTRGLIGAADLARMKPGAILVNTSRGPIIDEQALIEAVKGRRIVAALDVFDREPLPPRSSAAERAERGDDAAPRDMA